MCCARRREGTLDPHFEALHETIRPTALVAVVRSQNAFEAAFVLAARALPLQVRVRGAYSRHRPQLFLPESRAVTW